MRVYREGGHSKPPTSAHTLSTACILTLPQTPLPLHTATAEAIVTTASLPPAHTHSVLLACVKVYCISCAALQCRLYPVNYTFVTADVQRDPEPSCNNGSTNYTVCSTPSRLTDSQLGPQHDPTDNSSYYIFQGSVQDDATYFILFTFSQTVDVSNITLHYFVHSQGGLQPVVIAFGVGDNFELRNIQSTNLAYTIRFQVSRPHLPSRGLHSASTQGGLIISSKVILEMHVDLLYSGTNFSLSEVEFFSELFMFVRM